MVDMPVEASMNVRVARDLYELMQDLARDVPGGSAVAIACAAVELARPRLEEMRRLRDVADCGDDAAAARYLAEMRQLGQLRRAKVS